MENETTGSTGAPNAPLGTVPAGNTSTSTGSVPEPIKVGNDAMLAFEGSDKPIKASDARNFQAQFTKASQEAARLKAVIAERDARLRQLEDASRQATQPTGQPQGGNSLLDGLKALPYLSGEDAVKMVSAIGGEIQKRDQLFIAVVKELKRMQGLVGPLHQQTAMSTHQAKITNWIKEAGYDPAAPGMNDIAQEIYAAYEGADLDQEFPRIFTERLKQLESFFEGRKRAAIEQARKGPFVPGRGGSAGPNKPLQMRGNEHPRDVAEQLWNAFQTGSET